MKSQKGCEIAKVEYLGKVICIARQSPPANISPKRRSKPQSLCGNLIPMAGKKAYGAVRSEVPHNLRQIRQHLGLSLEELSARVGITSQTLQKYETEPQRLRVYQLRQLAEALECDVVDLVADTGLEGSTPAINAELRVFLAGLSEDEQQQALDLVRVAFRAKHANDAAA